MPLAAGYPRPSAGIDVTVRLSHNDQAMSASRPIPNERMPTLPTKMSCSSVGSVPARTWLMSWADRLNWTTCITATAMIRIVASIAAQRDGSNWGSSIVRSGPFDDGSIVFGSTAALSRGVRQL